MKNPLAMKKISIYTFLLCFWISSYAQKLESKIDWKQFISNQDMIFEPLTTNWHEGAFTGNGLLGNMIYLKDSSSVRIEIGRTDVVDHRPEFGLQYGEFRLPIGHFVLKSKNSTQPFNGRLSLYDATFSGKTDSDKLVFHSYTHALYDVIVVEIEKNIEGYTFEFVPELSVTPRFHRQNKWTGFAPEGYQHNPEPEIFAENGISFCYQPLLAGGGYCTAWKKIEFQDKEVYFITVGNSWPQDISKREAQKTLELLSKIPYGDLHKSHTDWWHTYYTKSFISLPDKQFENFWWIQQYKLGSATRKDAPAIDLIGPWFRDTPWAAYWFNLNVQLTYSPVYACNRLDLGESLISFINNNQEQLIKNCPEKYRHNSAALGRNASFNMNSPIDLENQLYPDTEENNHLPGSMTRGESHKELGNLTWLLHNYWNQYKYSMDSAYLEALFPLLKRSVNFYLNIMQIDENGQIHLPETFSPEYPGGFTRDCNYDLALFRWGCETLLEMSEILAVNDSLEDSWQIVLENLTDYPADENGLMIGRDVPFDKSHRHYSHLMMWYPLHVLNPTKENTALMKKSIEHWHSFEKALQGYSFTGGASMYAKMGDGDKSYNFLKTFMTKFLRPNTMYLEAGPVIETPLSAVASVNEMLLQSWGDTVRIFPAVPSDWKDVVFHNLRTEGAFLVSAKMDKGTLKWVRIISEKGGKLCLKMPKTKQNLFYSYQSKEKRFKNSYFELNMKAHNEVLIFQKNDGGFIIEPVEKVIGEYNCFGSQK